MAALAHLYRKTFKQRPNRELLTGEATEGALREAAPGKDYIHLATHGFFAPAGLRSALAPEEGPAQWPADGADERFSGASQLSVTHAGLLSGVALAGANRGLAGARSGEESLDDGILTAAEFAEIDLTRARLVVLSACETGLGDTAGGEGLLSLQRALHVAGARSAVTSLWRVPDDATRALMTEFYANLWQKGRPPLLALREAQRTIMTAYDPKRGVVVRGPAGERPLRPAPAGKRLPPFFWAGFVLSGDWR